LTAAVVALIAPLYLGSWLQTGLLTLAGAVAALGLSLLVGQAGQLSLGHAFFVAVGAYGYAFFAAPKHARVGITEQVGLALPPALAAVLAVLLAGLAGLLFTPIAARLRGIYLGIASLGLVFVGLHLLNNGGSLTGGSIGREVPVFAIPGVRFDAPGDQTSYLLGRPLGAEQKLWYLGLAVTVGAYLCYRNLVRGRPGRALRAVRDRELMAGVVGVPVTRYKAYAFLISSMYAGLGGVLLALAIGQIGPDDSLFGVDATVAYLVMAVIGGLGSPAGAILGAVFVRCLQAVLDRYADTLPGLAPAGTPGITPAVAATFGFGAAVIVVLLFEPGGAAAIGHRLRHGIRRRIGRHDQQPH
jgi:branched-chain amino acid transport system permease protein